MTRAGSPTKESVREKCSSYFASGHSDDPGTMTSRQTGQYKKLPIPASLSVPTLSTSSPGKQYQEFNQKSTSSSTEGEYYPSKQQGPHHQQRHLPTRSHTGVVGLDGGSSIS